MDSDSDRTIDSDELEEIIAQAKKEQNSSNSKKKVHSINNLKRPSLHLLSDSESDDGSKVRKIDKKESQPSKKVDDRPKCKYGSKCYRVNPDHKKQFYHPSKYIF